MNNKSRKLQRREPLEQSGDRICDLDFESGTSSSEPTEEQLTDGMDTNNFCDGQGATYELTIEFAALSNIHLETR